MLFDRGHAKDVPLLGERFSAENSDLSVSSRNRACYHPRIIGGWENVKIVPLTHRSAL